MLDVLEIFLNYHGHTYLRLDGATPVQKRQVYSSACVFSTKLWVQHDADFVIFGVVAYSTTCSVGLGTY